MASIAPVSVSCFRPLVAIIASTSLSPAHNASNTCLAALFEIVLSAIRLSKAPSCIGVTGDVVMVKSSLFNLADNAPMTQFAACFASALVLTTSVK